MKLKHYLLIITYAVVLCFAFVNLNELWKITLWVYSVVVPFIFGLVIAYIINFPFTFCQNKLFVKLDTASNGKFKSIKKPLSFIASYTFVLGIIVFLIAIIIPQLVLSVTQLVSNFESYATSLERISIGFLEVIGITEDVIKSAAKRILDLFMDVDDVVPQVFNFTKSFTIGVYNWIIGIVVSFYILGNKEKLKIQIKKLAYALTPPKHTDKLFRLFYVSSDIFGKYIVGTLIDSLIVGVLCFIGMIILRMPYALLISVIVGVTNIIPFFGPFIGGIPSLLILFIVDPMQALWFAIFVFILQQIDGNILKPKIIGSSIGLSGLWVMFSVIIGGGLFGVIGMIMGVPLFAVIYLIISEIVNKRLRIKNIEEFNVKS